MKTMVLQWCILVSSILPIHVFEGTGKVGLNPKFWKVYNSLKGPVGSRVKSKIYQGFVRNVLVSTSMHNDTIECNQRLFHIMAHNLRCPRAANDLKPYLDIMEFHVNMTRDERLVWSLFENNCTYLGGRSAKICQLMLSTRTMFVDYEQVSKIIHDCQSEHLKQNGGQNELLSVRSDTSLDFLSPTFKLIHYLSGNGASYLLGNKWRVALSACKKKI